MIKPPTLIAECGKVHKGNLDEAKNMIVHAKTAGFDWVKFQAYDINLMNRQHPNYKRYYDSYLNLRQIATLKEYADAQQIGFYVSCFNASLLPQLCQIMDKVKVAGTYVKNRQFREQVERFFNNIHITIPFNYDPINKGTVNYVYYYGQNVYPFDALELRNIFPHMGYSHHGSRIEQCFSAWLNQAEYIEIHFNHNADRKVWEYGVQDILKLKQMINDHILWTNGINEFFKGEFPGEHENSSGISK